MTTTTTTTPQMIIHMDKKYSILQTITRENQADEILLDTLVGGHVRTMIMYCDKILRSANEIHLYTYHHGETVTSVITKAPATEAEKVNEAENFIHNVLLPGLL